MKTGSGAGAVHAQFSDHLPVEVCLHGCVVIKAETETSVRVTRFSSRSLRASDGIAEVSG